MEDDSEKLSENEMNDGSQSTTSTTLSDSDSPVVPHKIAKVVQEDSDSSSCEEVPQPKSGYSQNKTKTSNMPRKKKKCKRATSKFLEIWKSVPEFKPWLQSRNHPTKNRLTAYCTACSGYLSNGKKDLTKHLTRRKHILAMETVSHCSSESQRLLQYVSNSEDKKAVIATIRICLLISEKNLSFNLIDWLIPTLKASFPDSLILEKVMMGRTKCGSIMRFGIGSFLTSTLVETLNSTPWSLVIDETTDVSVSAALAIVAQYYSAKEKRLMVSLIQIANCVDATAIGITDTIFEVFENVGLKTDMIVGFCADTCNAMFGAYNSVATILRGRIPTIVTVKCNCHMCHLCSQKASLELPKICEDVVRVTCTHFSRSPKRREAFKEFQKLVDCEEHMLLSPAQTRWLTFEYAVVRVLEQYEALVVYFRQLCETDPSTVNDVVLCGLEDPMTKIYLEFMSYALNQFNEFNALFQSQIPLFHVIKREHRRLINTFARNIMEEQYVNSQDPFHLNPLETDEYLPEHEIYLGIRAADSVFDLQLESRVAFPNMTGSSTQTATTVSNQPSSREEAAALAQKKARTEKLRRDLSSLRQNCRRWYIVAIQQLQERFDFSHPIYEIAELVDPVNARSLKPNSLTALFRYFPILNTLCDRQKADNEWREHASLPPSFFKVKTADEVKNLTVESYWGFVLNAQTITNSLKFPNLIPCISSLLSLPYSNAIAERIFSILDQVKTPLRNPLHNVSLSSLIMAQQWLKNKEATSASVHIPEEMVKSALKVKASTTINQNQK